MLPRKSISPLPLLPLLSAHRSVSTAAVIASSKTVGCRLPARPHPRSSILPSIFSLPPNIPDAAFLDQVPPLWLVLTTLRILGVSDATSGSRVPATVKKSHSCPSATHPPHCRPRNQFCKWGPPSHYASPRPPLCPLSDTAKPLSSAQQLCVACTAACGVSLEP